MNVSIEMRNEPCERIPDPSAYGGIINLMALGDLYRIVDPAKRVIDPRCILSPVIFRDGQIVSAYRYIIFWERGLIAFYFPQPAGSITIDGAYLPREG